MEKQEMHARFWMEDITGRLHSEERSTWHDIKLTHKERGFEDMIWIELAHSRI
jgi:hypothetical protein